MKKEQIIEFLKGKRPLGFKEIVALKKMRHPEARVLKRLLGELVHEGRILRTKKGMYGPTEEMSLLKGYFEAHRNGFGFVITDTPGERDLFIPPHATGGAMDNDRVIVRVEDHKRREGRIIRILERQSRRVSGRIYYDRGAWYLKPKNRSVPFDIYIPPKEKGGAKSGDSAIVEITEYPTGKRPPSGRVLKVLGEPETPKAEVEAIIEEFGLPVRFPKNVREEARLLSSKTPPEGKRKDLRGLPTVTIDGERARDFDDAVSIKLREFGYTLWVHIADVGHYVRWDSAVDLEARRRGTSVYFPDRVLPMLPKELSEDLASLLPKVDRLALTAEMDFDRYGKRFNLRLYPSVIKSNERMTYTSVKKIVVDGDPAERARYAHLLKEFELMAELAGILRQRRLLRGSLDFDLPEPEVLLDMQGRPEAIIRAERNFAHIIIEEFMIAANEAAAEHVHQLGAPSLYRVHEKPDPFKVEEIMTLAKNTCGRKFEDIPELLRYVKGRPEEEILNFAILRSLKQARYLTVNFGHFGLASECYTHFTSPIRRYPDLVVHRILREVTGGKGLGEKRAKALEDALPEIAFNSSRMERLAEEAERSVLAAMRVWFMKDRTGEEFGGKVINVTSFGLRIRLDDFHVTGTLGVSSLTDDFYQFDEKTHTLSGKRTKRKFSLGQNIKVRVDRVDRDEREIIFGC